VPPQPGLRAEVKLTVSASDVAPAFGTGSVPVLATPRVVALCEAAALSAVDPTLASDETTVSSRVELSHITPVAVGTSVTAEAVLERVEGRRLVFAVAVTDQRGLVAAGRVTRVVVQTDRFMKKVM
jgi:fluoroacetyl-CoA thioesterase